MSFPNVEFIDAKLTDALPLLVWPNDSVYDYEFQTGSLLDINGNNIEINDNNNDWIGDDIFNWRDLTWTGWITETPANNIVFDLGSWDWDKTFAITFKVKVLDIKPSWVSNWLSWLKNVAFATINDDVWSVNNLQIQDVELNIWVPELEITKTLSWSSVDIEAWSELNYIIEIKNIWTESAYIENLIDSLPNSLTWSIDLQAGSTITGSWFTVSTSSLTQSGNILDMSFDLSNGRSVLPKDTSVIIDYKVKPNWALLIDNNLKENIVSLDYYASDTATSNWLNNYWPLEDNADFTTKQPTITRTLLSTSESGTWNWNDVEIGEEAYFETIINLPAGTYNDSSFRFTENPELEFLTWSVVSSSWSILFSSWTTFNWDEAIFWTVTNSDLDPDTIETIILHSTFRAKTTATNWNKYTRSKFYYNSLSITKSK